MDQQESFTNTMMEAAAAAERVVDMENEFVAVITALQFSGPAYLASLASSDGLAHSQVRALYWKIFMGSLPLKDCPAGWSESMQKMRADYRLLKQRFPVLQNADVRTLEPNVRRAILLDQRLLSDIKKDTERLGYQGFEGRYFQSSNVQQIILHILFIWARENPTISYRQGMHELLAFLVYVLLENAIDPDSYSPSADGSNPYQDSFLTCFDREGIEADAYFMFSQLMGIMQPFYQVQTRTWSHNSLQGGAEGRRGESGLAMIEQGGILPISELCKQIHHSLLRDEDVALYEALQKHEIEPQSYLVRWIRLLFQREFPFFDSLVLWDYLFARHFLFHLSGQNPASGGVDLLSSLKEVSVVLLLSLRAPILAGDGPGAQSALMKTPLPLQIRTVIGAVDRLHRKILQRSDGGGSRVAQRGQQNGQRELGHRMGQAMTDIGGFFARAISSLTEEQRVPPPVPAPIPSTSPHSAASSLSASSVASSGNLPLVGVPSSDLTPSISPTSSLSHFVDRSEGEGAVSVATPTARLSLSSSIGDSPPQSLSLANSTGVTSNGPLTPPFTAHGLVDFLGGDAHSNDEGEGEEGQEREMVPIPTTDPTQPGAEIDTGRAEESSLPLSHGLSQVVGHAESHSDPNRSTDLTNAIGTHERQGEELRELVVGGTERASHSSPQQNPVLTAASAVNRVFRGIGTGISPEERRAGECMATCNEDPDRAGPALPAQQCRRMGKELYRAIHTIEKELMRACGTGRHHQEGQEGGNESIEHSNAEFALDVETIEALARAKQVTSVLLGRLEFQNCQWEAEESTTS